MAHMSGGTPRPRGTVERSPCPGDFARHDTTQQRNTHIRDVREIRYGWHPWHGRTVQVRANLVKRGQPVAYCSLRDVPTWRALEVPLWMLGGATCCKTPATPRMREKHFPYPSPGAARDSAT